MKKFLAALALLASMLAPAQGQFVAGGNIPGGVVLGYCFISKTTIAVLSTDCTFPGGTLWLWIESEGAATRYRADGTAPTATVGFALPAGAATAPSYIALAASIQSVQIIPQSGTMTLVVEFRR